MLLFCSYCSISLLDIDTGKARVNLADLAFAYFVCFVFLTVLLTGKNYLDYLSSHAGFNRSHLPLPAVALEERVTWTATRVFTRLRYL